MAVFNAASVDRINKINSIDDNKIRSYLYKLNDDLTYMFNNLTPDDNYSKVAYDKYVENGDMLSNLSISVDGIKANVVYKDKVVAAINLSKEGVKIEGNKITLEGTVTANNYFKINLDGSMEAKNGKFTGSIEGGTADIGCFSASSDVVNIGDFQVSGDSTATIISNDGRVIISRDYKNGLPYIYCKNNKWYSYMEPDYIYTNGSMQCDGMVGCEDVQFSSYENTVMYWIDWLYEKVTS